MSGTVDLNADLGEGVGDDDALLDVVTSANVACGYHAGDAATMARTCRAAAARGVAVGAHVAYLDRDGFGRREIGVPAAVVADEVLHQAAGLDGLARAAGTRVRYVKPHGALYHRAHADAGVAAAVVGACAALGVGVLGLPGGALLAAAAEAGVPGWAEGYLDRAYDRAGRLVPRDRPGAVSDDPGAAAAQAVALATGAAIQAEGGELVLRVRSLCVHGDTPGAVASARRARAALEGAGVAVAAFAPELGGGEAPPPDRPGRLRPVGARGVLVAVGDDPGPAAVAAEVRRLAGAEGVAVEVVPGAATVLVTVAGPDAAAGQDAAAVAARLATAALAAAAGGGVRLAPVPAGEVVEIPVVYDGADLAEVAVATGRSPGEVVAAHSGASYRVAFVGFAPGFAYLAGLPDGLRVGRLPSPRTRVPAGSVAIADRWSAVYPSASPGGWRLLGRTDLPMWDPAASPASPGRLAAGATVRFRPVERLAGVATPAGPAGPGPVAGAHLEVADPGGRVVVEDAGRPGWAHLGVAPSGWLDPAAAALANRLVGNPPGAAVLEITGRGPRLRLVDPSGRSRAVAVTGAAGPLTVAGVEVGDHVAVEVPAGAWLSVGACAGGIRAWLAVAGGIDVAPVLGSRSADVLGGLGPPPLSAGDLLPLGPDPGRRPPVGRVPVRREVGPPVLRVRPGPRLDWLEDRALAVLAGTAWTVGVDADRVGIRLDGARIAWRGQGELAPEGLVTGAIQVPPSGQPVLMLADHPVTGGYPVAGVVDEADLSLAARLAPGDTLRLAVRRGAAPWA